MFRFIQTLKYRLWRAAHKIGLDVYPVDFRNSVQSYLKHILKTNSIDCVWDIGANTGQYAIMLRNIGFCGDILSFEPIPSTWNELRRNAASDLRWNVFQRCAVGLNEGLSSMNVTADSVSSSLFRPINMTDVVGTAEVIVERLDSIIDKVLPSTSSLLKLDCQGGEYNIILSAGEKIRRFSYVQMETSIYPLYEGERTLFELSELMHTLGFDVAFIFPGIIDERDRMVQAELFFKRR